MGTDRAGRTGSGTRDTRSNHSRMSVFLLVVVLVASLVATVPIGVAADDPEGSDTPTTAQALDVQLGSPTTANGHLDAGDADWYKIEANRGELLRVNVTNLDAGSGRFDVALRRLNTSASDNTSAIGNGYTNGRVFGTEPYNFAFVAPADGTYLIRVGDSLNENNAYELEASRHETDAYEPNDQPTAATPYEPESTQTGAVHPGDHDWYRFDTDAGANITVNVTWPADNGGQLNVLLRRLNTSARDNVTKFLDETAGHRVYPGESRNISFVAPSDGTYLVSIDHQGTSGPYEFTVEGPVTQSMTTSTDDGGGPTDDGDSATDGDGGLLSPPILVGVIVVIALLLVVGFRRRQREE